MESAGHELRVWRRPVVDAMPSNRVVATHIRSQIAGIRSSPIPDADESRYSNVRKIDPNPHADQGSVQRAANTANTARALGSKLCTCSWGMSNASPPFDYHCVALVHAVRTLRA